MSEANKLFEEFSEGDIENIDLTLRGSFSVDKNPLRMLDDNREYYNKTGIIQHPDFVIHRNTIISNIIEGIGPEIPKVLDTSRHDDELHYHYEKTMISIFGDEGMIHIDPYYGFYAGFSCDHCGTTLNYLTRSPLSYGLCEPCEETTSPNSKHWLESEQHQETFNG